jgi:glycosyltransferase involved in cell wall biosynthesis
MVAYHFPPQVGSSGHLRTLKYSTYLPQYGWKPTVLSVHPRAYERADNSQTQVLPPDLKVVRAFALDTRKHLSFRKRYLRWSALPDRWVTWCLGAVPQGLFTMYRDKTDVIFTTFPVASALLIGYLLNRITGVPWIADFRDPMTEDNYPADARTRRVLRWLEKKVATHASRLIFTSASTMRRYQQRYRELLDDKCQVISNGYDEQDFAGLVRTVVGPVPRVRMQHSGLIYPEERNPIPFFRALSRLRQEGIVDKSWFSLDLRASGEVDLYRKIVAKHGIEDL